MRVMLTAERYPPVIGGAGVVAERVAEGLAGRGHEVTVVTAGKRGAEQRAGVRIERFPISGNDRSGISGDPAPALGLVERDRPEVVLSYAAQTWTADAFAPLLDRAERPAMVLAPCGFSALHDPAWRQYFERMAKLLPRYEGLIFHSSRYRDWEFAAAAGADRRHVIPNGADPPPGERGLRARLAEGERLAVTVSSHVRSKGHLDFIRAIGLIRRNHPASGLIVADRRRGAEFVRGCQPRCLAASLLPGNGLSLLDGSSRQVAMDAIASADVFLLPSWVECSPLVVLEAMAAGVPWVSYDVGNVREFAGGLIVSDVREMAAAASEILGGNHPGLGEAGWRAWDAEHRWERIVPAYEAVLAGAVELRASSDPTVSFNARAE